MNTTDPAATDGDRPEDRSANHWGELAQSLGADVEAPQTPRAEESAHEPPPRRSTRPTASPKSGWNDLAGMFGLPVTESSDEQGSSSDEQGSSSDEQGSSSDEPRSSSDKPRSSSDEPTSSPAETGRPPAPVAAGSSPPTGGFGEGLIVDASPRASGQRPTAAVPAAAPPRGPDRSRQAKAHAPAGRRSPVANPPTTASSPPASAETSSEETASSGAAAKKSSFWNPFGFFGDASKKESPSEPSTPPPTPYVPASASFSAPAFGGPLPPKSPGQTAKPTSDEPWGVLDELDGIETDGDEPHGSSPATSEGEQRPRRRRRRGGRRRRGKDGERAQRPREGEKEEPVEATLVDRQPQLVDRVNDEFDDELEDELDDEARLLESSAELFDSRDAAADDDLEQESDALTSDEATDSQVTSRRGDIPAWKDTVGVIVDANLSRRQGGKSDPRRRRSGGGRGRSARPIMARARARARGQRRTKGRTKGRTSRSADRASFRGNKRVGSMDPRRGKPPEVHPGRSDHPSPIQQGATCCLLLLLLSGPLSTAFVGCGRPPRGEAATDASAAESPRIPRADTKRDTIALLFTDRRDSLATAFREGVEGEARQREMNIEWLEVPTGDGKAQAKQLAEVIKRGYRAICISPQATDPLSDDPLSELVQEANAASVPIVIFDHPLRDATSDIGASFPFVATDHFHSGRQLTRWIFEHTLESGGKLLVLSMEEDRIGDERLLSIKHTAKEAPRVECLVPADILSQSNSPEEGSLAAVLDAFVPVADGAPAAIVALRPSDTRAVIQWRRQWEQVHVKAKLDWDVYGFGAWPNVAAEIRSGELTATVLEDPRLMGSSVVVTVANLLDGDRSLAGRVTADGQLLTVDTMDDKRMQALLQDNESP